MSIQSSSLDWIARMGGESSPKEKIVNKLERQAFADEMRMIQSLAGNDEDPEQEGSMATMDASILNDALMYDALSTISRLTGGAGLGRSLANRLGMSAYAPSSFSADSLDPDALASSTAMGAEKGVGALVDDMLGQLSARFESGDKGVEAVGYDRVGGTSYGKYQIASRTGTMEQFLEFLDDKAPDLAKRLRNAGPLDTGSTVGRAPDEWRSIAASQPERFERLQHEFIKNGHYSPAREKILESTGVDLDQASAALKEVLWSTSVQHGPSGAAKIFSRAIDRFMGREHAEIMNTSFEKGVIEDIYSIRERQFGSSTDRVRESVLSRLGQEKDLALAMLGGDSLTA